jgi:hypothetical protein
MTGSKSDVHGPVEELSGRSAGGRREWPGLAVLTISCLLYAMNLTVLNLAVRPRA